MGTLQGRVVVVAGATRGAGRAIACTLGAAGATVYCTGRSVRGAPAMKGRPETIEETAEMVTASGALKGNTSIHELCIERTRRGQLIVQLAKIALNITFVGLIECREGFPVLNLRCT